MYALLKAGANPNTQDNKGKTPLHDFALYDCEYEDVRYLLDAKADPNMKDNKGRTPLHYYAADCTDNGRKAIDLLVSKGANANIKDNDGKTPLQVAIDNNNIIECFLTENQKKLREQLREMVRATNSDEDWDNSYGPGIENLKKFLNQYENDKDLKIVLNVKNKSGKLEFLDWQFLAFPDVKDLLLKARATDSVNNEQDNCEKEIGNLIEGCNSLLSEICPPSQLAKLNEFLSGVAGAKSMTKLQEVVNEAIVSGVRLNFAKDKDHYFTDHVLEKIAQLGGNYEIASNIICALISRGGKLKNSDNLKVIDTIELKFKDHKANMIRAHIEYVNYTEEFFRIAKYATNGQLCDGRVDNSASYLEYSEDSIIDVAKITDRARNYGRDLIKIGKSEVEIITEKGIRNYTDLADGSDIILIFYTSLGELEVRLYPDKQDLIRVEVKDQEKWEKLKNCEEEIGKNCLLGGYSVYDAIEQGYFERRGKLVRSEAMSQSNEQKKGGWCERISMAEQTTSRAIG